MVGLANGFLNDRLIQVSLYAGVVFWIVAHPETFKFVDGMLDLGKDKNMLLLVHAVVVAVLMYFGTKMIFDPVLRNVIEGITSGKKTPPKKPSGKKPAPKKKQ